MHGGRRGTAAVIVALAIPVAALGGLAGFATAQPDEPTVTEAEACAQWAVEFRHARADLAAADDMWRNATRDSGHRPVDRADFQDRVKTLEAARPANCNPTGRLTR
jgi:hypothetical protein